MSFHEHLVRDARLVILRALAGEVNYTLNEALIERVLETYGHRATRDFVRNELRWLEREAGAVTVTEVGEVLIATLTRRGRDHVERKVVLEGVARPSPEA